MGLRPWENNMKCFRTTNTVKTVLIAGLLALTLACGYSSNYSNPSGATSAPAISQLNPDSATAGGDAFTLIVTGSNFASKATVNWNGAAQSTAYVSGTQLTVAVPAAMIANSGTVQITVTNPAVTGSGLYGTGGSPAETSTAMSFTIN
jgi:hypothetical protein